MTTAIQNKSRFKQLDGVVKKSFAEAAEALREIRDEKLYLAGGFDSFKEYCEHIEISYLQGYRLIEAGKIAREIPEVKNVATGMAVAKIPPRKRLEVVNDALNQNDGKLTAKAIQNVSKAIPERKNTPPERPVTKLKHAEVDKNGTPIPSEVMSLWNRRDELQSLITGLQRTLKIISDAQSAGDLLFKGSSEQNNISKLKSVIGELKCAMPEYVCPYCNGVDAKNCSEDLCGKRGLLANFWWQMVDPNIKSLHEH